MGMVSEVIVTGPKSTVPPDLAWQARYMFGEKVGRMHNALRRLCQAYIEVQNVQT